MASQKFQVIMTAKGGDVILADLKRKQRRANPALVDISRQAAQRLLVEVRDLAPRDTGGYADRIHIEDHTSWFGLGTLTVAVVSPDPFARRLEFGFVGRDSLGRDYNQQPRPHWRPATESALQWYEGAVRDLTKRIATPGANV